MKPSSIPSNKDTAHSATIQHRNALERIEYLKCVTAKAQGGCCSSCIQCKATQYQLYCTLKKGKLVKDYNVCHHWTGVKTGA